MIKRRGLFIFVLVLFIALVGVVFVLNVKNERSYIKIFDVNEYQYYIENSLSEESLGPISNEKDLLKKVELIWIRRYGKSIKNERPYQVFYDKKNGIWLIQGTLRANMDGGVANALVENDTGKVLAVWHDK